MRKFCLALAAVSALVLGGWATYGVAGPPDLTVVSDSVAMEAVGGQSCPTKCYTVYSTNNCSGTWIKPCGTRESCPGYLLWNFYGPCGNTMALGAPVNCVTTCCNILCGQYTPNYVPCN